MGTRIVLFLLILFALLELLWPSVIREGFSGLVSVGDSPNWSSWAPKRGDVGIGEEEGSYIQDERYFRDYTDVQRFGVKHDFCRMVAPKNDPDNKFFACALAGTDNLSSVAYKTNSFKNGFRLSRDDYMRDIVGNGGNSYCRILKIDNDTFETRCNIAEDKGFSNKTREDTEPPDNIAKLLTFYEGILFWFRFKDDMMDYASNLKVSTAGRLGIEEFPANPQLARTLQFDGLSQFMRVGDSPDMTLGTAGVPLRSLRAFSFWVKFDSFTNNAHILDFGNGAGRENIFIGILGKGNPDIQQNLEQPLLTGQESTVPNCPSGAQPVQLMSPQQLMLTTSGNTNDFECRSQEVFGEIIKNGHLTNIPKRFGETTLATADLIYEIWDQQQRRMRIHVPSVFTVGKWTHVVITADTNENLRPPISVYINNKKVFTNPSGYLPQTSSTAKNYIGKSNWIRATDPMNDKDQLFQGSLFDLRAYKIPLPANKIKDFYTWGLGELGLEETEEEKNANIGRIKRRVFEEEEKGKYKKKEREKKTEEEKEKDKKKKEWDEYGQVLEERQNKEWYEARI